MWIRSAYKAAVRRYGAHWLVPVLIAAAIGGGALYFTRPHPVTTLSPSSSPDPLNRGEIQQILAQDAIPAVDHPHFVAANKTAIRNNMNVIGIELGGEAHAYPIPFMSQHEIVNDRLGGTNIAATW